MRISGFVNWELAGEAGEILAQGAGANLVLDTGAILLAKALAADSFTAPTHLAIGDDDTAAATTQTDIQGTELARVALDSTTRTTNTVTYVATFPAGTGTGTVEEAGIFNAASSGEMLCRFLTGTITKGAGDTLTVTWTITLTAE